MFDYPRIPLTDSLRNRYQFSGKTLESNHVFEIRFTNKNVITRTIQVAIENLSP